MNKLAIFLIVALVSGCASGPVDYGTALQAAAQGGALAQFNLGWMYTEGKGVTQDYAEAVKWYRLSAAQSYAPAQHNLGVMYDNGQGVTQDYTEAMKWYRLSAAQGYVCISTEQPWFYVRHRTRCHPRLR